METVYLALRVVLSLAVVLGVLWMLHRRLTRGGRMLGAAKPVTVVTRQAIAGKASVVIIDVDGQRFLLGVTEQSVTVLNSGDAPLPEIAAAVPRRAVAEAGTASGNRGAAFARVLSEVDSPSVEASPVVYLPQRGLAAGLDGSILSPDTWKRTAAALRRTR